MTHPTRCNKCTGNMFADGKCIVCGAQLQTAPKSLTVTVPKWDDLVVLGTFKPQPPEKIQALIRDLSK